MVAIPKGFEIEQPEVSALRSRGTAIPPGFQVEQAGEPPAKEESWPEYLGGLAKSAALPVGAGIAAARLIPGVGIPATLAKAGIDVAAEGISQATGLSPRSNAALALAAVPGPLVEGGRALYQGARRMLGHGLPGAADVLKEEATAKALAAADQLKPPISSKQLYQQLDQAGQGVAVEFPKTLQEAKRVGQRLERRLHPPAETKRFAQGAERALQTPGTPATPAHTIQTGLLNAQGQPITRVTPGTPGTPPTGISVTDALSNMSDIGDDIRAAQRAGDNKLAKDLTAQRVVMGEDFKQSGLGAAHQAAGRAFRQEQGAKEVASIIETATRSEGGVDKMNIDRAVNAIKKMAHADPFFKGSFDPGKLDTLQEELRGLAVEVKKYSRSGELMVFGGAGAAAGYAVGGSAGAVGGMALGAALPKLIAEALGTPNGRAFLHYLVKEGKGTVSAPLLKAFLQSGRVGLMHEGAAAGREED